MKQRILLIIVLTSFLKSFSQTTAPGDYVTKNNDTISAQIKIPKSLFGSEDFSKFLLKVEVTDSISGTKKLKPEDIKSFGFNYNEKQYRFFSKPTMTQKNLKFLQPLILGPNTSIYQFSTVNQNGSPLGTFYTFEKADGTYMFLSSGIRSLDKIRDSFKEFYKDNLEVQQLIDSKFKSRSLLSQDMKTIVQTVNK